MIASLITNFDWQDTDFHTLRVLDLACGAGQNGAWFAEQGSQVHFIDRDLSRAAEIMDLYPQCIFSEWDMEQVNAPSLEEAQYDVILVFNYLYRPLFSQIKRALKQDGLLFYETFTTQQASIGRPKNPNFLLKNNELNEVFYPWPAIHYEEGRFRNNLDIRYSYKANIICRKT